MSTDIQPASTSKHEMAERFQTLMDAVRDQTDTAALFKLVSTEDWRAIAHTLPAPQLKALREAYVQRKNDLDGRVKLEEFDKSVIVIIGLNFWKTEKYGGGEGVTLTYSPESDPSRICRSMTSSAIVYRFASGCCNPTPPTAADPVRAYIELVPVRDPQRAAEGQRQWSFRALPSLTRDNGEEGAPF